MKDEAIHATAARGLPKRSRKYTTGRLCSYPGCITRLSAYNHSERCYAHARREVPRLRGKNVA